MSAEQNFYAHISLIDYLIFDNKLNQYFEHNTPTIPEL